MAVPLIVRGRVLAVLGLGRSPEAPEFNDDDRGLVEEIAGRAALALDNALLLAEERAAPGGSRCCSGPRPSCRPRPPRSRWRVVAAEHIRQLTGPESRVAVYEVDASHRALAALTISGGSEESHRLWAGLPLSAPVIAATAVVERRPDLDRGRRDGAPRPTGRCHPSWSPR